jgi:hypothetical protein
MIALLIFIAVVLVLTVALSVARHGGPRDVRRRLARQGIKRRRLDLDTLGLEQPLHSERQDRLSKPFAIGVLTEH